MPPGRSQNPNYNQKVPWNGSPDGSGKYNDGPGPGSYNQPDHAPKNGYSNNTPPATPINAPGGDDYTAWNWEQVLNGVLGLKLPDRSLISGLRWTVSDDKGENSTLFQIFGFSGGGLAPSFYVYLSPDLQGTGGPWDEYYNTPVQHFSQIFSSSPPDYTTIAVDPRTFGSAAEAFDGVQDFYLNAAGYFYTTHSDLQSEVSQYKGQGGEAFDKLINNLFTTAGSISGQMGNSLSLSSYGGRFLQSGTDTANFVVGLWQTIGSWQERLDHSPMGAILQAILDAGVVAGSPGNYIIPNVKNAGSFGDLLSDSTWVAIETEAKKLWAAAIQETLDTNARSLINTLTVSYLTTAGLVRPLTPPTLSQISPPDANNFNTGGPNSNGGLGGLNGLGDGLNNLGKGLGDGLNNLGGGLGNLGSGLGGGLNGLGGGLNGLGLGLGGGLNGLGGPNQLGRLGELGGLNGLGGPNGLGGLNGPARGPGLPGGLNGLPGLGGPLGGGPGNLDIGQLRTALADNTAQRKALERALALAPSSGPLHNELERALAENGMVGAALRSALAGNTPAGTALDLALAGNDKVRSLLNHALASGQVPKTGPLRTALQQAAGDNAHTRAALRHALGSAVPGGDFVHTALADNGKLQHALRHLLTSGQIPKTGPLHNALEAALAKSQQAEHALDRALASGGTPSLGSIQTALADNRAVQHDLTTALGSGQIPANSPLRGELHTALTESRGLSSALRHALTSVGVPAEPVPVTGLGLPAGPGSVGPLGLGGLTGPVTGGGFGGLGGVGGAGGGPAFTGGLPNHVLTGPAGPGTASGLPGLTGGAPAPSVSSGRFVAPPGGTAQAPAGSGTGAVPFFPPMAGGGMGMGGQQQQQGGQERERTTWLAEDEDVWGTAPTVGPASIGRDFADLDDDTDSYDDFAEPAGGSRRNQYRQGAQ